MGTGRSHEHPEDRLDTLPLRLFGRSPVDPEGKTNPSKKHCTDVDRLCTDRPAPVETLAQCLAEVRFPAFAFGAPTRHKTGCSALPFVETFDFRASSGGFKPKIGILSICRIMQSTFNRCFFVQSFILSVENKKKERFWTEQRKFSHLFSKDGCVKLKISVILPVHNAEQELVSFVNDCFETTGDIRAECEIVLIDDASTDASRDIAENLSLEYPQIKVLAHSYVQGVQQSILNGLRQTDGNLIYIHYITCGFMFPQITLFYDAMPFTDAVLGRFLDQKDGYVGLAMMKRQTIAILGNAAANPEEAVSVMKRNGIRYLELRYEARGDMSNTETAIPKITKLRKTSNSIVSTF